MEVLVFGVDCLLKLNEFFFICNVSFIKKIRELFEILSERIKRRYVVKVIECLIFFLEIICFGESDDLKDVMFLKCESFYIDFDVFECIKVLVDSFLKVEILIVCL